MAAASSSIKFTCPSCRKRLNAPLDAVGTQVECPSCRTPIVIPAARAQANPMLPKLAAVAVVVFSVGIAISFLGGGERKASAGSEDSAGQSAVPNPSIDPSVPASAAKPRDPALELGLPRSGKDDFASMATHYGFHDYGTAMLDSYPTAGWNQILNEHKNQIPFMKAVLTGRGCTREEWYGINDRSGAKASGTFRSKSMLLCATLPVGLYTVIEKEGDRLLLTQSNEVKGTALWPDDWRTLMGAMPLNIILEGGGIRSAMIAVDDRISFIGIQTAVAEEKSFTPVVRPLGVRNETTKGFFNLENPASPVGELPGAVKANAAAEERAAAASEERAAKKAEGNAQADEAEAALRGMAESAEQQRRERFKGSAGDVSSGGDPFASGEGKATRPAAEVPADLTSARADLEKVNATIESERVRWQEALEVINRLTVNKTKPVREGSPPYHECMAASKVIHEVEQGAQALKDRKVALEARVKELEK